MTDEKTEVQQTTSFSDQNTSQTTAMTTVGVAALSVSNAGGACATSAYHPGAPDTTNKGLSIGSITFSLWELAVKSAIKIASARNKSQTLSNDSAEAESTATTLPPQRALPPLPAVPPVGPGGRRKHRAVALTRSQSACSKYPPPSRPSPTQRALTRSQSMADLLSALVAARLKPTNTFLRSTHCQECNQRFSLIFRRHHCRICQRSVCAYCSTYQHLSSDLEEEESETEPTSSTAATDHQNKKTGQEEEDKGGGGGGGEGIGGGGQHDKDMTRNKTASQSKDTTALHRTVLQRVCRKCASELEGKQMPHCRMWTEEFSSLRQFFKQGRRVESPLDNHHLVPPKIPKLPPVCESIARSFLEECKKNVRNKSRFQTTSASFNAGLQYALKPPDQKLCTTCSKLLRFPGERKTCALCDKIFCRFCSSRDLALSAPDNLDPGDTQYEMAQINVRILSKEEAEELDRHYNSAARTTHIAMQRYRACHDCRDRVAHVLRVMNFNDTLTQIQGEMVDLQEQIAAVLDEQDIPSPGIGMTRWPSVRSVHAYTSVEDEIIGEAVSQRVAQKLLERFFQLYLELERLQPETVTQGVLLKHVKQATSAFYVTRRSVSSKRFSRRDSITSLPPSSPIAWF